MSPPELGHCSIRSESDLLDVRTLLRHCTESSGLGLVERTKFITAGSELARNIIKYAPRGGEVHIETLTVSGRRGLRATFVDRGPGIPDIAAAMKDGFSTGGSLGIGLPGSRRLVDEFDIESQPGHGTKVTITKWCEVAS